MKIIAPNILREVLKAELWEKSFSVFTIHNNLVPEGMDPSSAVYKQNLKMNSQTFCLLSLFPKYQVATQHWIMKTQMQCYETFENTYEATPTQTGYFEVSVEDKLIHSKKYNFFISIFIMSIIFFVIMKITYTYDTFLDPNGDGFVNTEKKYQRIVEAISKVAET
ncbi:hypothetical protein Anas_09128 [Armadillidium nasatum]|uniref:Uncharacterized protein n=1 Tax=Armadillidium nasatum TaxID=96803 RepID=A0A5N5TCD4_9CRUS|nr:hypothetical protein Anas_09128 [Armadillidium nasatum]